jgi:hypothetical protein
MSKIQSSAVETDFSDDEAIASFRDEVAARAGKVDAVSLYHAVRQLPYLSSGDRSLQAILTLRAGSCSSKHILLDRLLASAGIESQVELVQGDFATPLRDAYGIPAALKATSVDGIPDIHNVVRARVNGKSVLLDATWNDYVKPFGLRVNDAWDGNGDTVVAADPERFLGTAADPAAAKAAIIESWPQDVQKRRRQFLENINAWIIDLEAGRMN